jgi:hypothetical protein
MKIADLKSATKVEMPNGAKILFAETHSGLAYAFEIATKGGSNTREPKTLVLNPRTQAYGNYGEVISAYTFLPDAEGNKGRIQYEQPSENPGDKFADATQKKYMPYEEISREDAQVLLDTLPENTPLEAAQCARLEDCVDVSEGRFSHPSEIQESYIDVDNHGIRLINLLHEGGIEALRIPHNRPITYERHEKGNSTYKREIQGEHLTFSNAPDSPNTFKLGYKLGQKIPTELGKFLLRNWQEVQTQREATIKLLQNEGIELPDNIQSPNINHKWEQEKGKLHEEGPTTTPTTNPVLQLRFETCSDYVNYPQAIQTEDGLILGTYGDDNPVTYFLPLPKESRADYQEGRFLITPLQNFKAKTPFEDIIIEITLVPKSALTQLSADDILTLGKSLNSYKDPKPNWNTKGFIIPAQKHLETGDVTKVTPHQFYKICDLKAQNSGPLPTFSEITKGDPKAKGIQKIDLPTKPAKVTAKSIEAVQKAITRRGERVDKETYKAHVPKYITNKGTLTKAGAEVLEKTSPTLP